MGKNLVSAKPCILTLLLTFMWKISKKKKQMMLNDSNKP